MPISDEEVTGGAEKPYKLPSSLSRAASEYATNEIRGLGAPVKPFGLADTWPGRILQSVASGVTLPHDVMTGDAKLPSHEGHVPGSVPFGDPQSSGERVADLAMIASPSAPRAVTRAAEVPTSEALKASSKEAYKRAAGLGIELDTPAMGRLAKSIEDELKLSRNRDYLSPNTFRAIKELETPAGKNATLDDIDTVRELLGQIAANPQEKRAATMAISRLDDYLQNIPKEHVIKGDHEEAGKILREARSDYAPMKRAERIEEAMTKAQRAAATSGSGANIDNATRQAIKNLLNNPKKMRGFSDEEKEMMEQIARGDTTSNLARKVGKLAPTGVVSAMPTIGAALAGQGPLAAIMAGTGYSAKALGDRMTQKGVERLLEKVRSRSASFEKQPKIRDVDSGGPDPRLYPTMAIPGVASTEGPDFDIMRKESSPVDSVVRRAR